MQVMSELGETLMPIRAQAAQSQENRTENMVSDGKQCSCQLSQHERRRLQALTSADAR
jgi:hypothetical protein